MAAILLSSTVTDNEGEREREGERQKGEREWVSGREREWVGAVSS